MGEKSVGAQVLASRMVKAPTQAQLAFDDAGGSSILRSAADKLGAQNFQVVPKKMGRPRGSRNRDAAKLLSLVSARVGTDPLLAMADYARLTPEELAKVLLCTRLEAAQFQFKCLSEVNAYARGKPTQRVEVTGDDGVPIFAPIFFNTQEQAEAWQGMGFSDDVEFIEENEGDIIEVTPSEVTVDGDDDASL